MNVKISCLLIMSLFPTFLHADDPLEVGASAPAPTVTTHTGERLALADVYQKGPTLVYFYPKADTPGCTKQACNLRDQFGEIREAGIQVVGVSSDGVKKQAAFAEKYQLPFTLVADGADDKQLGKAFGVGSTLGFYSRQSFLVIDGVIAWRDLSATPGSQTRDVLKALREFRAKPS